MTKHEETEALVLWRCMYTEDDRDCDGIYFLPPVFVLAPHEDEAWNRSSPLVAVPEGCYATGCYEARPATEDEAQEWMAALEAATVPAPPVAGEPEREALALVVDPCAFDTDAWADELSVEVERMNRVRYAFEAADRLIAAGYEKPETVFVCSPDGSGGHDMNAAALAAIMDGNTIERLTRELAEIRRQPEPREVATVGEFALVGLISGKHIPVTREDAEQVAARGGRVEHRLVTEWTPITPSTEETP